MYPVIQNTLLRQREHINKRAPSYGQHVGATTVSERQHPGQLDPDAFFTPFTLLVRQVQVVVRLNDVPTRPRRSHKPRAALSTVHYRVAVVPVLDSVTEGPRVIARFAMNLSSREKNHDALAHTTMLDAAFARDVNRGLIDAQHCVTEWEQA